MRLRVEGHSPEHLVLCNQQSVLSLQLPKLGHLILHRLSKVEVLFLAPKLAFQFLRRTGRWEEVIPASD